MLHFVDETFRDGPQSLWATRMRTESMLGAAPHVDRSGYARVCVASGASFETAVKFLHEDPWERLRLLKAAMPNSVLDMLIRSRNLMGWERYPDEVIELFFRSIQRAGIEFVKVFDGLNDVQNIEAAFRIARKLGMCTSGILTFSLSPVHTDAYFAEKAAELVQAGVDSITLGDASGLLTAGRTKAIFAAIKARVGDEISLEFVSHHSMGLAHEAYREAVAAGAAVSTACRPLANGESLPSTLDILQIARELGTETSLDVGAIRRTEDYLHWVAYRDGHTVQPPHRFDQAQYDAFAGHQIPGGMISNFRKQLRELGLIHRLDEVLLEASRVREELGYPIMVTPFSQFVGVQATFNVIEGERYKTVPKELYLYVLGHYGSPPGTIDPNVKDRILGGQRGNSRPEPLDFGARIVDEFRRKSGPFKSDEDLLLQLFYGAEHVNKLRAAPRLPMSSAVETPLRLLVQELARESGLKSVKFEKSGSVRVSIDYQSGSCDVLGG